MMHLKLIQLIHVYIGFLVSAESTTPLAPELTTDVTPKPTPSCSIISLYNQSVVKCNNIEDNQVIDANANVSSSSTVLYYIDKSSLRNITAGVFANINLKTFSLNNSKVENFDLFGGFNGSQDSLLVIHIQNVSVANWKFSSGRDFKTLFGIEFRMPPGSQWVVDSIIPCLPETLERIYLQNFVIKYSENFTFNRFSALYSFCFPSNGLTSVNRSYLPLPAPHLGTYDLSYNPIKSLPKDMFKEMPNLEEIWLQGTHLTTLHYQTFQYVLDTLVDLRIEDNPLMCDCDAAWLLRKKTIWKLASRKDVICDQPVSLKNYDLARLEPTDMCYNCKEIHWID